MTLSFAGFPIDKSVRLEDVSSLQAVIPMTKLSNNTTHITLFISIRLLLNIYIPLRGANVL
ncbi:hypothetical protein bcere0030_9620 [Bacillus cereus AH1273]|nr:hypothetical protein bcere0030_9620 [Bacillus cereus AH1273]